MIATSEGSVHSCVLLPKASWLQPTLLTVCRSGAGKWSLLGTGRAFQCRGRPSAHRGPDGRNCRPGHHTLQSVSSNLDGNTWRSGPRNYPLRRVHNPRPDHLYPAGPPPHARARTRRWQLDHVRHPLSRHYWRQFLHQRRGSARGPDAGWEALFPVSCTWRCEPHSSESYRSRHLRSGGASGSA